MCVLEAEINVNNINIMLGKIRTEAIKLIAQSNTLNSTLGIIKSCIINISISANRRPPVRAGLPKF
jgi:hypothetical protein